MENGRAPLEATVASLEPVINWIRHFWRQEQVHVSNVRTTGSSV